MHEMSRFVRTVKPYRIPRRLKFADKSVVAARKKQLASGHPFRWDIGRGLTEKGLSVDGRKLTSALSQTLSVGCGNCRRLPGFDWDRLEDPAAMSGYFAPTPLRFRFGFGMASMLMLFAGDG